MTVPLLCRVVCVLVFYVHVFVSSNYNSSNSTSAMARVRIYDPSDGKWATMELHGGQNLRTVSLNKQVPPYPTATVTETLREYRIAEDKRR